MKESPLQKHILRAVGAAPDLRVWRNNTGQAWTGNKILKIGIGGKIEVAPGDVVIRQAHPIKFGLIGSSDIIGLQRGGRFVGIEVKGEGGRVSEAQGNWGNMILSMGGVYIQAWSVEDALKAIP